MQKTTKNIMIAVSALALRSFTPSSALAQGVTITCPPVLSFGRLFACNDGTLTVTPSGGTTIKGCGAKAVFQKALPAQCIVKTTGAGPPKKSVKVSVTMNAINMTNAGSAAKVNQFEFLYTGITRATRRVTLSPTEVSNTVTLDVGARLSFNNGQVIGNYVGLISVTAN